MELTFMKLFSILFLFKFAATVTPLIPRKEFLSTNDYSSVTLSPDGKYLVYIAPSFSDPSLNGSRNIYIKLLPNGTPKRLTNDQLDSIISVQFAYDNKTLFYLSDPNGDENFVLNMIDIVTSNNTVIENDSDVQTSVWKLSPKCPLEVVLKINKRNRAYYDVYSFNIETGVKKLIFENNYFINILFNYDLQPVLGYNQTNEAGQMFYRLIKMSNGQINVELIKESPPASRDSTKPLSVDLNGISYWFDADFSDKIQLVSLDPSGKNKTVLLAGQKADLEDIVFHPATGRPLWAYENYMKSEPVLFDNSSFESDFANLRQSLPNSTLFVKGLSLDNTKWLISSELDNTPPKYYLYDAINGSVLFLLSVKEALTYRTLASAYPVEILTSDGLTEVCYIVLPVDYDLWKNGTPYQPLPTVLFVHGGPRDRDYWEYDQYSQYLASRNYVVLKCNFRGSTGYGKTFINAGNGEMGRKMQQDLTDAVHWATENKIADPIKVAIAGYSYGGYATLAGLTFTPDLYACGVDVVGPSDMISQMQMIPAYWKPRLSALKLLMGADTNSEEGRERLRQISPLFFADRIKKPLLIGQGANDPRVKRTESDRIFNALKANRVSVEYMLFSNEGHGFKHPENNIAFWAVAEKFLADCLGGRLEPISDEIDKSTANIQSYITE